MSRLGTTDTSLNISNIPAEPSRAGSQNMRNPHSAPLIGSEFTRLRLSHSHYPERKNKPPTTWAEAEPVSLRRVNRRLTFCRVVSGRLLLWRFAGAAAVQTDPALRTRLPRCSPALVSDGFGSSLGGGHARHHMTDL